MAIEQRKLYTVATSKEIPCLGGICGPLTTPVHIDHNDLVKLIRSGYEIYQCNPYDSSEKVRVTLSNINTITFKRTRAMVTSNRLNNRAIREMESPITVDVVKKDEKPVHNGNDVSSTYSDKKENKNKQNESKDSKPVNDKRERVSTPDGFTK